jgi:hypothetical protein
VAGAPGPAGTAFSGPRGQRSLARVRTGAFIGACRGVGCSGRWPHRQCQCRHV